MTAMPAHVEVANLVYSYAERIDLGDFAAVAELFTHAEITTEGMDEVHRGADAALAMYEGWTMRHADGTPRTKHVTTNLILDVDDIAGTATCRSYFTVFQQTEKVALQPIIAGRYHDHFERADGSWRFTHRHILTDLVGDLSDHLFRPL